jgi:hypothetical protein
MDSWRSAISSAIGYAGFDGFYESCSSPKLRFKWGLPLECSGVHACVSIVWVFNELRDGYYVHEATASYNNAISWTSTGMRAVSAHEIGHVVGLDEQYHHNFTCNSSAYSVEDLALATGFYCDSISPTSTDVTNTDWLYDVVTVNGQQASGNGSQMLYIFRDRTFGDWAYYIDFDRWAGGNPVRMATDWLSRTDIGYYDRVQQGTLGRTIDPSDYGWPLPDFYRACIQSYNELYGKSAEVCTNWAWLQ